MEKKCVTSLVYFHFRFHLYFPCFRYLSVLLFRSLPSVCVDYHCSRIPSSSRSLDTFRSSVFPQHLFSFHFPFRRLPRTQNSSRGCQIHIRISRRMENKRRNSGQTPPSSDTSNTHTQTSRHPFLRVMISSRDFFALVCALPITPRTPSPYIAFRLKPLSHGSDNLCVSVCVFGLMAP